MQGKLTPIRVISSWKAVGRTRGERGSVAILVLKAARMWAGGHVGEDLAGHNSSAGKAGPVGPCDQEDCSPTRELTLPFVQM